jgi:hypothetical protein
MQRVGVRDIHPGLALVIIALLQLAFLGLLFRNYVLGTQGWAIRADVLGLLTVLFSSTGGALAVGALCRARRVRQARRALEREARDASFEPLRSTLAELSMQAGYTRPVALRYHARHANALHATQEEGVAAVVVGLAAARAAQPRPSALSRDAGA